MRIFKFRAWDGKEFLSLAREVAYIDEEGVLRSRIAGIVFDQFTGLTDRLGKDIYEGDIIGFPVEECLSGYAESHRAIVRFGKKEIGVNGYEFIIWLNGFYAELAGEPDEYMTSEMMQGNVYVLGNIYENSDLLKEQTE